MVDNIITAFIGTKHERDLRKLVPLLHNINEKETWAMGLGEEDFPAQTEKFKERLGKGESLDDLLPEAFALVREAARRTLGERPYDVQLLGGIVLHQGKIMELKTGEGKTLASVAPAYLNSLAGKGVHMVTVNDYLAERDANWMRPVFAYLGITVGVILSNMDPEARKKEYSRDITYGTNNEFGFDYLRDNMRWDMKLKSQQNHHYAIIDEIDSILIDEARTPLIISGPVEEDTSKFLEVNRIVKGLKECEKDPELDDYPPDNPLTGEQPKGDYKLDEKGKRVLFTDEGMNHIEELLQKNNLITGSLFDEENFEYTHYVTQALKAHELFHLDVDYVIQDGQVQIVDEFTGRVLTGRRYSDGLHQAIEAKENIKVARKNQTLATITFQNFFRMYDKISGMTGTADTEAKEFVKIYNIDVVVIPTNRPVNRVDADDVIYLNEQYKMEAICDTIQEINAKGQPILVGTVSVEKSEQISRLLLKRGVRHEVLNAKNHGREAHIIAEAGAKGAVTIATNMAGRGTDIKLGGNPEMRAHRRAGTDATEEEFKEALAIEMKSWRKDHDEVLSLGGLYVIGSERHESRRIDNQLRGRSGRQGDPGYSQFYISLDDSLMRLFGGDRFKTAMKRFGFEGDEPLQHSMINNSLERAQKKVEERNYDIRKHLLDYDDVLNKQRTFIYEQRDEALTSPDLTEKVLETGLEILEILLDDFRKDRRNEGDDAALTRLYSRLKENFNYERETGGDLDGDKPDEMKSRLEDYLKKDLEEKKTLAGQEQINWFIRAEYLRQLDKKWQEHLENLEALREAVSLRSYAQKNPLVEYKNEGFAIFEEMIDDMRISISRKIFRVIIRRETDRSRPAGPRNITASHNSMGSGLGPAPKNRERNEAGPAKVQVKRTDPKVGRNDPCPCGSGKKYKKCCGA
ncbi:MAG: preprotein translocase subunit SecA [Spirochaetales bacterium]|nr:preprotein translocase subunit SecA [Spirochaetales bacterium]